MDLVLFVHRVAEVNFNQVLHLVDGLELETKVGMPLVGYLEKENHRAKRVSNKFYWILDFDADLLDLFVQLLRQVLPTSIFFAMLRPQL